MTTAAQLASYASSFPSFRNLLINGGATISQRGDVDGIVMSGASNEYTAADRWCIGKANVGENGTLDTTVTNQVLRIDVNTTNTNQQTTGATTIRQIVEAQNCSHLSGQQVTLSFKFKTNKLGNYGVFLFGYDANAFVTPQTMEVTNTNTNSYSFTFTTPSSIANDTGEGIGVNITLWAGSARANTFYVSADGQTDFFDSNANYCELSEVQLEEGTVATPFEHRPIGTELALCQRYFEKSYDIGTAPGSATGTGTIQYGYANMPAANYVARFGAQFKVSKRSQPTIIVYDSAGNPDKCNYPDTIVNQSFTVLTRGHNNFSAETSSLSNNSDARIYFHYTAESEL